MKNFITILIFLFLGIANSYTQELTQRVRGKIVDVDSKMPLIGAEITIVASKPIIGTTTDENGNFRFENIPVGRIDLQLSYLGYEDNFVSNILVNSGKEVVLDLHMEEAVIDMEEIVVTANQHKGDATNEMAILSARSISAEETNRYAGGFNDPSRIMSNFAGVTNTQDGSNDIIIRGNSPKYVQWRLEGIQITNPNHFADQSAVGGAVSTLNNNLLARSDFYTGAFTAEFGDVLSGVYDVKLRAGNNENLEAVFGFGLLGTDLTLEGPFKKGYGGSYLINYRYSTASIISDLGLIDVNGIPKFQDAAFKLIFPTKKIGVFSLFGLGGRSSFLFEDVTPATWETPGHNFMKADIREDYKKVAYLFNTGVNHTLPINASSYFKTTISYSNEAVEDDVFESKLINIYDQNELFLKDSIVATQLNFQGDLKKSTYRIALTYNNKINAKNKLQLGSKFALQNLKNHQSQLLGNPTTRFDLINFNENISTLRNFISWKHRINPQMSFVGGIHNMNVLYNNKSTIEPRIAFNWKVNNRTSIFAGYGKHSTMESIHNYFAKVEQSNNNIVEPNQDLGLLKAHHFVLGYDQKVRENMRAKVELYYQYLYNLPVENNDTSYYATINEGLEFRYVDLVNKGTGWNYGVELTLEKFFSNNYYYLINASLFDSKYKSLSGEVRNTQYNSNFLVNILFGREFPKLGKKNNQTLGLNAKLFFGGGKKIIPLLRDDTGLLAVNPENNDFWDYDKAYENDIEDSYSIILSASYKWNRAKATHELFLNLDNVTNTKGKITEFYDDREPNDIGYMTQFGFFPDLMYRVYF